MNPYVIYKDELYDWIGNLIGAYPVFASRQRENQPGFYHFDKIDEARLFQWEYTATTLSVKKAFSPPNEIIYRFEKGKPPRIKMETGTEPFVVMGVHPCDLSAIVELDKAYTAPPADALWLSNRDRSIVVGFDCQPDEYCFCNVFELSAAREGVDVFMTPVSRGFLVEIHTEKGVRIWEKAPKRTPEDEDLADAKKWREKKISSMNEMTRDVEIDRVKANMEENDLTGLWKEVSGRCYGCGSCNTVCPTCYCFDMEESFDISLKSGVRRRKWDSCQLYDFALIAGDYNFRSNRWERVQHRFFHKFVYLANQFGRYYCTGCGRCSRACTADINILRILHRISEGETRR